MPAVHYSLWRTQRGASSTCNKFTFLASPHASGMLHEGEFHTKTAGQCKCGPAKASKLPRRWQITYPVSRSCHGTDAWTHTAPTRKTGPSYLFKDLNLHRITCGNRSMQHTLQAREGWRRERDHTERSNGTETSSAGTHAMLACPLWQHLNLNRQPAPNLCKTHQLWHTFGPLGERSKTHL